MRWILGLVGALIGSLLGEEEGLAVGLVAGVLVGWALERERARAAYLAQRAAGEPAPGSFEQRATARLVELSARVTQLEQEVAALRAHLGRAAPAADAVASALPTPVAAQPGPHEAVPPLGGTAQPGAHEAAARVADTVQPGPHEAAAPVAGTAQPGPHEAAAPVAGGAQPGQPETAAGDAPPDARAGVLGAPHRPAPVPSRALEALRALLFGGNTVVRVGVLVLTVGVGLLVKYAAEQAYFPLELRLAFAAAIGLALIVLGYRLRHARAGFGTALQGGGVAAIYLVTFFAYYAYQLLPPALTMALLVAVAALSTVLAVAQNAVQLAVFGAIGGFLAPVLASTGRGDHVALFSYYALLNAAIAASALFRSWRLLNWVGFAFTFGIASAWGALRYEPEHMASASFFLALFFLFYVLNGTLFALKQPPERRGLVDTTLTFGTPLATLALAGGLYRMAHLYLALACVAIASVYLASARLLLRRRDPALQPLARCYVAIGVAVSTLAIPFALENALATSLAWAAEACGLVWVGLTQRRLRTRVAAYLLFLAALGALALRQDAASDLGRALVYALMASGLGFAAASLERSRQRLAMLEPYVGHVLFATALTLWMVAWDALFDACVPIALRATGWLGAAALTAGGLEWIGGAARFPSARKVARFTLPMLLLGTLTLSGPGAHPFANYGWLGFVAAIGAGYAVLRRQATLLDADPQLRDALHAAGAYLLALLAFAEARYATQDALALAAGWVDASCLVAPLACIALALARLPRWPVAALPRAYLRWSAWPSAWAVAFAALICQGESTGDPAPLPYVPLLNPLDLAQALAIALLLAVARSDAVGSAPARRAAQWGAAASVFIALNGTVVRAAHHWNVASFRPWRVPDAPAVQATFSILWTALALLAMIGAHRRGARGAWIAGAALLAAVVAKLFFVDLEGLSSVAKIVTFLAVGVLLLLIGYLAPVPPSERASAQQERT